MLFICKSVRCKSRWSTNQKRILLFLACSGINRSLWWSSPRPPPRTSNINTIIYTWPWSPDGLLQIIAEGMLSAQICLVGTGQPEPPDFLICPTELCLFGFCKILKCFGRYIIKTYNGNTGNEKILGTEQRWVFSGWTYLIKAKHPWFLGLCIQPYNWHFNCWRFF